MIQRLWLLGLALVAALATPALRAGEPTAQPYVVVVGIDRYLPASFGKIHPRWKTPWVSILVQAALSGIILLVSQIKSATAIEAYQVVVEAWTDAGVSPLGDADCIGPVTPATDHGAPATDSVSLDDHGGQVSTDPGPGATATLPLNLRAHALYLGAYEIDVRHAATPSMRRVAIRTK